MNAKAWTVTPWLAGVLWLALSVPCALAAETAAAADAADAKKGDAPCVPKPKPFDVSNSHKEHAMSPEAKLLPEPPDPAWFKADPCYPEEAYDSKAELDIYSGEGEHPRQAIDRPRPPVELGLRLYDYGAYAPRPTWFGEKNPMMPAFIAAGDFRIAAAQYDRGGLPVNGKSDQSQIAARLNLDMDLQITPTERIHAFTRPIDRNGSFTRYLINGQVDHKFVHNFDFNLDTLFFEGDLGAMAQGLTHRTNGVDLPVAVGRTPIVTQNGVWIEDAIDGAAFSITAKSSPSLDISNMDFTFFAGFNNVTTAADPGTNNKLYGFAGFADLLRGYLEYGYGYLDADVRGHSYSNVTVAFSKRYMGRLANSVRLIGNFGQKGVNGVKTADGLLVLVENSLVPRRHFGFDAAHINPLNFVPYFNLFAGFKSPQSLARGGDSGGVLRNTGINFESDGLTGYPTLDATAHDSYGGAVGLEYLFSLDRQIVVEVATVQRRGDNNVFGAENSIGARYQHPFTKTWIVRLDAMKGWRQGQRDIYGARVELRRKF
jgi:hypothetical protein